MQILITGAAGFIGYSLSLYLLKKKIKIFGIDNLNNYYSQKLKKDRLKELKKYKNFTFNKIDITKRDKLNSLFASKKFDMIINLAAQAGVRYSLLKPSEFVDNNILGFYNIINLAKENKIKKIFYASSSSVYGDSKKFPLKENYKINPKNIYALSKKNNEEMAAIFSQLYKIKMVGLRFFTVFGEWGRPDMFMMKYLNSSYDPKKKFYLNNFGNHTRDFTYIDDVCEIVYKLIIKDDKSNIHNIFNVCSNNPIKLLTIINKINLLTNRKPKMFKRSLQEADVVKTHGSNKKILSFIKKKNFVSVDESLKKTFSWFMGYYKV